MNEHPVGICTWSLKNDPEIIFQTLEESGLSNLHVDISAVDKFQSYIDRGDCTITGTMVGFPQEDYTTLSSIKQTGGIVPDDCWEENRTISLDAISRTARLHVPFLSTHIGFIDHADEQGMSVMLDRIRLLGDAAEEAGIMLLLETGQESAETLRACLEELNHPAIGVNFDPANMILYGKGDPVEAVRVLGQWIGHVHIKDAVASSVPGEWGQEVPWGDGDVDTAGFFQALEEVGYTGTVSIEREAGNSRMADIKLAAKRLSAM